MQIPFFYEPLLEQGITQYTLSEETSRHCVQVLRMSRQDKLYLTNGKGDIFLASFTYAHKKASTVFIEEARYTPPPTTKTHIAISILKNTSRWEWFLEKAVEIGITSITPLICQRTEKTHFRYDRMHNIAVAAMIQSQQTHLVTLQQPTSFTHFLAQMNTTPTLKLIAHCEEENKKMLSTYISTPQNKLILIGPEGDFSKEEIQLALKQDYQPVSLGNTRLRTETAGIYSAVILKA